MAAPAPCDVLVIGSGIGGAITSLVLAEAGLDVVCLEQGGWTHPADHPHGRSDWEAERLTSWQPESNRRRAAADYPIDTAAERTMLWNAVGGATNIYAGIWPRFRPSDFRKGREHGLAPDWPLSYEELAPFYDRTDRLLGTSGLAGDPAWPPRPACPTPPLPPAGHGRQLAAALDRLGWHWWPLPSAILSADYDGRPACNGCGACLLGCPRGSMSKLSLSLWPKALAAGARLQTEARVERIETDRSGRATGAVYVDRASGLRRWQPAAIVVLAANAVGTPRLLLLSDNLANSSDQVGRNLMHHTLVAAELWLDQPVDAHQGAIGGLISAEFAETDRARGFVNGFHLIGSGTLGAGIQATGSLSGVPAPWGNAHHAWFRRHFGHGFAVLAMGDDLPQPANRVTLSARLTDSDGLAAPAIAYRSHDNDRRLMRFALDRLAEVATGAGAFEVRLQDYLLPDPAGGPASYVPPAWHLLGTCRMGSDPASSVTNRWHQSWDVPNLYIIDSSSLVTGGAANPASTIAALALRAAEHLRDHRRDVRQARRTAAS